MKAFIAGVLVMGVIRFLLTVSGLPDETVKYFSMSVVIAVGAGYFALVTTSRRERLQAAFLLIMPYMIIEVAALAYTWATGHPTSFHAQEYSFGVSIGWHTIGHLVGGFTWEPLILFVLMEVIRISTTFVARLISGG